MKPHIKRQYIWILLLFLVGVVLLMQSAITDTNVHNLPVEALDDELHMTSLTKNRFGDANPKTKENTSAEGDQKNLNHLRKEIRSNTTQDLRRRTMRQQCKNKIYKGKLPDSSIKRHLIEIRKTKLVFCDIPKSGSTFLKQVLHILAGHSKSKNPFDIGGNSAHTMPFDDFQKLSLDEAFQVLQDSTKFLFVRNPYTRLLSGFVDKLFTINFVFWDTTGKLIIKNHRPKADVVSLKCGHNATFPEFVKHVTRSETQNVHRNPHWYSMVDSCRPCNIKYDIIGKLETFQDDLQNFLRSQNLNHLVNISKMNEQNDWEAVTLTTNRAYETMQKKQDCLNLPQALERAWRVLQIRGVLSHLSEFPYEKIKKNPKIVREEFLNILKEEIKLHPMSNGDKRLAREQALAKAFGSLQVADLENFNSAFHPDFSIFGYEKILPKTTSEFSNWQPFELKL